MRRCLLLLFICAISCSQTKEEFTYYRAINNNDTAYLAININGNDFYGKYGLIEGWEIPVIGDITGKVKADTLTGTFIYTPYQHRHPKRVAFALLSREDKFLLGSGAEIVYMGIPHYAPGALYFDAPKFIFEQIEKPSIFK